MTKLRNTLTIGVVVVAAIGAAAGFYVVNNISPEAARMLLAVEAGVLAALAIIVQVLMGPTVKRIDDLIEALRALARGEKYARVEAADFAGFADVARAVNEVAASLCENDDPNLGPVQKRVRERPPEINKVRKPEAPAAPAALSTTTATTATTTTTSASTLAADRAAALEISEHPTVGAVRVRKKTPPAEVKEPTPRGQTVELPAEPVPPHPPKPASTPSVPPAAPVNPPVTTADVDNDAPDHDDGDGGGNDTVIEAAPPQLPNRLELQALFAEFVKEKKAAGHDDVEVDFDAFAETIVGECERLLSEHGCKGVRFEVAVSDGDVSLRPRLLR